MSKIIDTFIAPPCHDQIETLYQDESLVLINKPAGLLSLSGKTRKISIRYIIGWCSYFLAVRWSTDLISALPG
jgi:hypothetical protein